MWIKHPFFKYITAIILILIAIFFLVELNAFTPVKKILSTLFYPILIAGFLFYLIRPLVRLIAKPAFMPVSVAILLVFSVIGGIIYTGVVLLADTIQKQIHDISNLPSKLQQTAKEAEQKIEQKDMGMVSIDSLTQQATKYFGGITEKIGENITQVLSAIAGTTTVLIIVPIVLFFFLKDGHRFVPFLTRWLPQPQEAEGKKLLRDVDQTLAAYIIGQVTVAIVDGVLTYIGYLIIGLDYALVLSIFVAITAIVPFFGPIIGLIPALVVALMQDPSMALLVILTLIIVQQLEGNLVAPLVLGNQLHLHPLTIILLLVVAAPLFGFIGMVVVIPFYAVIKVILKNLVKLYQLHSQNEEKAGL